MWKSEDNLQKQDFCTWIPGVELKIWGLAASPCTWWAISSAPSECLQRVFSFNPQNQLVRGFSLCVGFSGFDVYLYGLIVWFLRQSSLYGSGWHTKQEGGKMGQLVLCLFYKHEDLSWIPNTKAQGCNVHTPVISVLDHREEGAWGLLPTSYWKNKLKGCERPVSKSKGETGHIYLCPPHACTCDHIHTNILCLSHTHKSCQSESQSQQSLLPREEVDFRGSN